MLQKLIDELNEKIQEQIDRETPTEINHAARLGKMVAYEHAVQITESYKPDFEKAIKKAYEQGYSDGFYDNRYDDAQDYYNQNYKK